MTRVLYRTALAVLLTGNAIGLATLVADGHVLPALLGAVASGYCGVVVLAYAAGAAWHARRPVVQPPQPRQARAEVPSPVFAFDAAVADEWATPSTARHGAQPDQTLPLPRVDLSQWSAYEYRRQY